MDIIAEMHRSPDAHLLVEWIEQRLLEIPTDEGAPVVGQIEDAIHAYTEGLEG